MTGSLALAAAGLGTIAGPLLAVTGGRVGGHPADHRRVTAVTLLTALVFAALTARLADDPRARYALPAFLLLAGAGVVLALVDLDVSRLPDVVTLPGYPVLALLLLAAGLAGGDASTLSRAALGALACLALYAGLCAASPDGLGFGDVKLAGLLGMALGWLSWSTLVVGMVLGFGYGALASLVLVGTRRATLRSRMPFGPAMLAGALTGVLLGEWLAAAYLDWAL